MKHTVLGQTRHPFGALCGRAAAILLLAAGCSPSAPSGLNADQAAAYRSRLLLADEPPGAQGVEEVWQALAGTTAENSDADTAGSPSSSTISTEPRTVLLMGRIGGPQPDLKSLTDFPWDKGRAAFVVTDPSVADGDFAGGAAPAGDDSQHSHAHGEAGHDCPFCSAQQHLARAQAIVQFPDDAGQVIPVDARDLFGLRGDELVVIRGKARLVVGMLMVDGEALYVRR